MGFFDRFRRSEPEENTVSNDQVAVSDQLLRALLNDETITVEKAMMIPAVNACVSFIANTIATMPVKLYRISNGKVKEVNDNRVRLINNDTGDTLDGFQMKRAVIVDYLMGKGGYIYIGKNRNEVVSLHYVDEQYISTLINTDPIHKHVKLCVNGAEFEQYEFVRVLRNTKDGGSGTGLTVEVSKALETAFKTLVYQLGLVRSGGAKKGFLKSAKKLGQQEIDRLRAAWSNLYNDDSENCIVLNQGLEFQEASATSTEMQLDQNKKTLNDEIQSIFEISDDFDLTFKKAIYPAIKAFETALNSSLLLEKEKKNHFFEFDVKEIVRTSLKERYEAYQIAKNTGFMTLNEIRRAENMEYIDGLDVINVGLGAVLYDVNKHYYYTPNTDTVSSVEDETNGEEVIIDNESSDQG